MSIICCFTSRYCNESQNLGLPVCCEINVSNFRSILLPVLAVWYLVKLLINYFCEVSLLTTGKLTLFAQLLCRMQQVGECTCRRSIAISSYCQRIVLSPKYLVSESSCQRDILLTNWFVSEMSRNCHFRFYPVTVCTQHNNICD